MDGQRPRSTATSFADQVHSRLKSGDRRGAVIEHPVTPALLRMLGFPPLPLSMAPGILFKLATGKGGARSPLTPRQIEHLPELLDDPVAVFTQPDKESLAVLTSEWDAANNPVIVCVRPRCRDGLRSVNAIATAFGKDRADEWARREGPRLIYRGTKENPRLPLPGLTYYQTGALKTEGCERRLLGPEDLRKFRERLRAKLGP